MDDPALCIRCSIIARDPLLDSFHRAGRGFKEVLSEEKQRGAAARARIVTMRTSPARGSIGDEARPVIAPISIPPFFRWTSRFVQDTLPRIVICCSSLTSCLRTLDLYKEVMESHKGGKFSSQKMERWNANPTAVQFGGLYVEHSSWRVGHLFSSCEKVEHFFSFLNSSRTCPHRPPKICRRVDVDSRRQPFEMAAVLM